MAVREEEGKLTIYDVDERGPSKEAKIEIGDVILSANEKPLQTRDDLAALLKTLSAGQEITFVVMRQAKEQTIKVKLVKR